MGSTPKRLRALRQAARVEEPGARAAALDEALDAFEPSDVSSLVRTAYELQQDHPAAAVQIYRWVIRRPRPEDAEMLRDWLVAHNNACYLYQHAGPRAAAEIAYRARSVGPDNVPIFHNAACVFCGLGKLEDAMDALRSAAAYGYEDLHLVPEDEDLAVLRDRPDFRRLFSRHDPGPPPSDPRIEQLRERIARLRAIDRHHSHLYGPRLQEGVIAAAERELGTRLPEGFRAFLLAVGDGTVGDAPYVPAALPSLAAILEAEPLGDLAGPFEPEDPYGHTLDDQDCNGLLEVGHAHYLVTAGPRTGEVWLDNGDDELFPSGHAFLAWYERVLDQRLRALGGFAEAPPVPAWASFFEQHEYERFVALVEAQLPPREAGTSFDHLDRGAVYVCDDEVGFAAVGLCRLARACRDAAPSRWPGLIAAALARDPTPEA